jgi:hypothetical protein
MGSDFPFRIGDEDPVRHLEAAGLRARDLDLILRENAGRLLFPSPRS